MKRLNCLCQSLYVYNSNALIQPYRNFSTNCNEFNLETMREADEEPGVTYSQAVFSFLDKY